MANKPSLKEKQRALLDAICREYNIKLTQLAKQCGVSQTTLTRWYNGNPKHALSATTMGKIEDCFPILSSDGQRDKGPIGLTDTEQGMLSAIQAVIIILSNYDVIRQNDLKNVFSYQQKDFRMRAQPGAAQVMDQLIEFLNESSPEGKAQDTRKPLRLGQDQSKNEKSLEN